MKKLIKLFTVSTMLAVVLTSMQSCEPNPCYDTRTVFVDGVQHTISIEISCYDLVNQY